MVPDTGFDYQRGARGLRKVAYVCLVGDLVWAAVFVILRPLSSDLNYYIVAFMTAGGVGVFVFLYYYLSKRYEMKAQSAQEFRMKKQGF